MSDWLKRITSIISQQSDHVITREIKRAFTPLQNENQPLSRFTTTSVRTDPTFAKRLPTTVHEKSTTLPVEEKENMPKAPIDSDDNLKALKRLRDLPRGTNVDSRIAAIKDLLGETEIFKTLKMLRWPQGVVCPRCRSSNVVRRDPPADAIDQRHFYVCLNCKGEGDPSDFDDFTGLPIGSIHALRQWILCWYLIGFCSVNQIAKVLGLSLQEVLQIASIGNDLASLPDLEDKQKKELFAQKERKAQEKRTARANVELNEEYTRSESRSPLKPGYKSKK
ncbi:transposase [Candidatus Berkiella aquae]|uniref:Transposase n=1 Tax=Candidatus Berkiella aquae TaxID=295108 RepID=A0A0Q9YTZ3_9GAMM|nr:transposase [Candidatus Berkiella aquae]MCS5711147.1 transposase [Candidatus Berkiella aquae]